MSAPSDRNAGGGSETLRVTLISSLPPHKGVADYTAHLVGGLAQIPSVALEVIDFASLYPGRFYPGGELLDPTASRPEWPNVRIRTMLRWYNPLTWIAAGLTLRGAVVHAQWWSYALAPAYLVVLALARLRRRRILITVHNVEPHETAGWKRFLNDVVLRLAGACIVHDSRSRERLTEMVGVGRPIAVIGHGLLSAPGPEVTAAAARRALGLPDDAKTVLFFGNVRPYKGVDVLVRAFARVQERLPGATLIVAGNLWEDWAPYAKLIDDLGVRDAVITRLEFIPARDVGALFAAADVVALPYLQFDAQSGVGARAVYHGKALVVTDVGGLPELAGDSRSVVPPGDVARLAEALRLVLVDDAFRAHLEEASRAVAHDLRWDVIAEQTAAFYHAQVQAQAHRAPAGALVEERSREERV